MKVEQLGNGMTTFQVAISGFKIQKQAIPVLVSRDITNRKRLQKAQYEMFNIILLFIMARKNEFLNKGDHSVTHGKSDLFVYGTVNSTILV